MPYPNTLIFVDFPSSDPAASAAFYAEVFGWLVEPRPEGVFYRIVPGQHFQLDDGSPSPIGNLHMGIYDAANARPHPETAGVEPRELADGGRSRVISVPTGSSGRREFRILTGMLRATAG